jgi:hypothetical protein
MDKTLDQELAEITDRHAEFIRGRRFVEPDVERLLAIISELRRDKEIMFQAVETFKKKCRALGLEI